MQSSVLPASFEALVILFTRGLVHAGIGRVLVFIFRAIIVNTVWTCLAVQF